MGEATEDTHEKYGRLECLRLAIDVILRTDMDRGAVVSLATRFYAFVSGAPDEPPAPPSA